MAIQFTLNNPVNNDQTSGQQTDGNDTDVAVASLIGGLTQDFYDRLSSLALIPDSFATDTSAASQLDSVTVTSSDSGVITSVGFTGELDDGGTPGDPSDDSAPELNSFAIGSTDPTTGDPTGLTTVGGDAIYLFRDADDGLGDQMVLGVATDGTVIFTVFMVYDPADGTIDLHQVTYGPIFHPNSNNDDEEVDLNDFLTLSAAEEVTFDFNDLPAGQNLFGIVGNDSEQLVIMPENPDLDADNEFTNQSETTNTSKGGGPVTIGNSNQMIDPGEGFFFYYVSGVNPDYIAGAPDGLDQNEADDADNVLIDQPGADTLDVDSAFFDLVQVQGNSTASVTVTAYLLPDGPGGPLDGVAFTDTVDADESPAISGQVNITSIQVFDLSVSSTIPIVDTAAAISDPGISVILNGDGTASITGLDADMRVKWFTDSLHNLSLVHGDAGKFDIGQFGINQPGGQAASIGDNVIWDDDAPSVAITADANAELRLDETDNDADDGDVGGLLASASIAAGDYLNETVDFGTDGFGSDVYSFDDPGGASSGLTETASGDAVVLTFEGGDIVGRNSNGDEVIRFSIDGSTGEVTATQSSAVVHGNPADPDESATPETLDPGSVVVRRSVTDGDDDGASDTSDISAVFLYEDDGPSVTITADADAELRLDETDNDADDGDVGGLLASASIGIGDYLSADTVAFGSDGEGTSTYSFDDPGGASSGLTETESGDAVVLTLDGGDIVGRNSNGDEVIRFSIDGSTGEVTATQSSAVVHGNPADPDESATPETLDPGSVVVRRSVTDGDDDGASDTADISAVFLYEDDGPSVTITADADAELRLDETDNDGDDGDVGGLLASASIGIGDYLSADTVAFGSDGEGTSTYSFDDPGGAPSGLTETASGDAVVLTLDGGDIVGRNSNGDEVIRFSIDGSTGEVTATQSSAVVHGNPADPDESATPETLDPGSVVVRRLVTDGDDDGASDTADISAVFLYEDDGPTAALANKGVDVVLDETDNDADDMDVGGVLADVTTAIATLFDDTSAFGSDGAKDADYPRDGVDDDATTYSLVLNGGDGVASGLTDTFTDKSINLYQVDDYTIEGRVDADGDGTNGDEALALEIIVTNDPDDVQVIQHRAVKHGDPTDPDEADTPESIDANKVLLKVTVTDGDLDANSDTAELGALINIEDDGPAEGTPFTLTVEEDDINGIGNDNDPPGGGDGAGDGTGNREQVTFVINSANIFSGVDQPVSFDIDDTTDPNTVLPILLSQGQAITWETSTAAGVDYVRGYTDFGGAGQELVVELALTDNGNGTADATVTISGQLDHQVQAGGGSENTVLQTTAGTVPSIDFTPLLDIRDGDGDALPLSAEFLQVVNIDDTPEIAGPTTNPGVVDFLTGLSVNHGLNGSVGSDLNDGDDENQNDQKAYTFTFAADANETITSTSIDGLEAKVSDDGTKIEYFVDGFDGNPVDGDVQAGELFFDVVLGDQGGSGDYTFNVYQGAPPVFSEFDFEDLPSGQNLHGTIANDLADPTLGGLLLIPEGTVLDPTDGEFTNTSQTTNTSKGGGPVTIGNTNQMFNPGEGHYFAYVSDTDPAMVAGAGLDQNNADDADTVQFGGTEAVTTAQVEIVQVQGNSLATIRIEAFDVDYDAFANLDSNNGLIDTETESRAFVSDPEQSLEADQPVIISIAVYDTAALDADPMAMSLYERTLAQGDDTTGPITVEWDGGTAIIGGLGDDVTVEFTTDIPHDMSLVSNVVGKYDLGGFNLLQVDETPDQLFDLTVEITDFDGDTDGSGFQVLVDGTGKFDDGVFDLDPPVV